MNKKNAEILISRIYKMHTTGNDKESVDDARILLANNSEDKNVRFAVAGVFIDSGGVLGDIETVKEGLDILQKLLEEKDFSSSKEAVIRSKYNLSNGYYVRFGLLKKQGKYKEANKELKRAKSLIQDVLLNQDKLGFKFRSQAMCNYGNILDYCNRSIEAIDWYYDAIKFNANHAVAMANCGIAIRKLLDVSGSHKIKNVYEVWMLLTKACEMKKEVESYAGLVAYKHFEANRKRIVLEIEKNIKGGIETINNYANHRIEKHGIPKAEKWLDTINIDRLLLTLNQNPINSESECIDDLFFINLITLPGVEGEKRFRELAHSLNILKEDFITARYIYYHSIDAKDKIKQQNIITRFANTFDKSSFDLELGMIKASFRIAADCLGKVAILVNEYYQLNPTGTNININNIWYEKGEYKLGIHTTILNALKKNPFLEGLKNLQEDWFLDNFPGPLKEIRNSATHLKLIIYEMRSTSFSQSSNNLITENELSKYTYYLLRIVKAAIIYMVCAINFEESKKVINDSHLKKIEYGFK